MSQLSSCEMPFGWSLNPIKAGISKTRSGQGAEPNFVRVNTIL